MATNRVQYLPHFFYETLLHQDFWRFRHQRSQSFLNLSIYILICQQFAVSLDVFSLESGPGP